MLDRKLIHSQLEAVQTCLENRYASDDMKQGLQRLSEALIRRKELQGETDELRAQRNSLTKQIGPLMKAGKHAEATPLRDAVKDLGDRLGTLEAERKTLEDEEQALLLSLPNMLQPEVPTGKTEDENIELRKWG